MEHNRKLKSLLSIMLAWLVVAGCGSSGLDVTDQGGGHGSFEGAVLSLADTGTVLADWSIDDGWRDSTGEPLSELPPAVRSGDALEPLRAGGPPAYLQVQFRSRDTLDIAPLEAGDTALQNPCGEFSARYFPLDDATEVIAWPNVRHPDQPDGPLLFANRSDGELVQIFHCNELHIYPERAGRAELELLLWHVNHADQASDALAVQVLEGP